LAKNQRKLWRRIFPTAHKLLLEQMLRSIYEQVGGRVLIVGAGKEPYKQLLKSSENVIVTDVGEWHAGLDEIADAHALPYGDESFDYVLAIEVFEHLRKPAQAVAEVLRVLKPGGSAIVTVPFMFRVHGDPCDYQRFTKSGLEVLFEGFSSVQIQHFGGRIHVVSDIITTIAKPFFFLRCVNRLICIKGLNKPSTDCPSGYFAYLVK
jgi:SAM-dependent methyltransferase